MVYILGVDPWVSYHDVSVESDGQNGEDGHGQESVAHEREEDAEGVPVDPGPVVEEGGGQGEVEAAEHEVGDAQVDDEHGRSIPYL